MINGLKDGSRKLSLRIRDFMGVYQAGLSNNREIIFFGQNDNELYWPEDKLVDLVK